MKLVRKTRKKPAGAPGTIEYTGEHKRDGVKISLIDYDSKGYQEKQIDRLEDCFPSKDSPGVTWINIDGVHEIDVIEKLGRHFDIHDLVLEDIAHTDQRPKMEDYENYIYVVLKMLTFDDGKNEVTGEQVSIVFGKNFVISLQEKEGDVFGPVRIRVRSTRWRERKLGADYLAYALLDAIIDHYFIIFEKLGGQIEEIEEELNRKPTQKTLSRIHHLRREMIFLRKSVWPLRDVISNLRRNESDLIRTSTDIYLKDTYDHTVQVMDTVESMRDLLSGMLDLYLSGVSNRMNEIMKVLTIIATIFIPPTFIAGVYGMNFDNMPELHTRFGYFVVLGMMAGCIGGMVVYFRKKGWF